MLMFRADGNSQVGAGHIMRCLSIADAGRRYAGEDSLFVLASDDFKGIIEGRGYRCAVLGTDYRHMESETGRMEELIYCHKPRALVADSYYVTVEYLDSLKDMAGRVGGRLVYLDDVMAFAYPCHILINYNIYGPDQREFYEDLYKQAGYGLPKFLLGTDYVPLREEFQNLAARETRKEAKDILISTGGADMEHIALGLAQYLVRTRDWQEGRKFDGFRFHFIVGAMNGDLEKIQAATGDDERIVLHVQVTDMQRLMSQCDTALSAAGSTLYELCAAQTPAVTYILADNQEPGAKGFERYGVLACAGDARTMERTQIPGRLLGAAVDLARSYERRKDVIGRQRALVDGDGAKRIVDSMLACV